MKLLGRRAECDFLDSVLSDALDGRSRVAVLRGDAGAGKSALLDYVMERSSGWRVVSAAGVESEMELDYSGLHQLSGPLLDRLDHLPAPQRAALATVFGYEVGPVPGRFLVGLATLSLLADAAEEQPLLCMVDDAQWLDVASAQILLFVARRLLAERIAFLCAARTGLGDHVLVGLPVLVLKGLGDSDARALLLENLPGPLDAAVCEQLITESHGNPLALLELPRTRDLTAVAGGFGIPANQPVTSRIEESFANRLLLLPAETRLLVLAAAAEPLGDPLLLNRAAKALGLDMAASGPAVDAGLLDISGRVSFAHPVLRSAAYGAGVASDRRRVHAALAEATDPERDPDRRAWHRGRAADRPDEEIAVELERSAGRAQARGGVAAAAAFLERAAALSPDAGAQARRLLAASEAKQLAGAPQAASALLAAAADGSLDDLQHAHAKRLRGQIALDLRHAAEAAPLLLEAASRFERREPVLARDTYLEAFMAASFVGTEALRTVAESVRTAPPLAGPSSADDLLLQGLAIRFAGGYAPSARLLQSAIRSYGDQDISSVEDIRWPGIARRVAPDVFEDETWRDLASRSVQLARDRGALGVLPLALNNLAFVCMFEGECEAAAALIEEANTIADTTGALRLTFGPLFLGALRGDESSVLQLAEIDASVASARNEPMLLTVSANARALLYNGLGRYDEALSAAESPSQVDNLCTMNWSLVELIEAATRCRSSGLAATAMDTLTERTQAAGTAWALGIEARSRALLRDGSEAEGLFREAIEQLGQCRITTERARALLLYGEWLRREGRRVDAREQLRAAHGMFTAIGMEAFAERTRRELAATGENVRSRQPETRDELTAQEAQIAQLARDGLSNAEIGAQLFLSPRTVEWHLRKVFQKLGIRSRRELGALPEAEAVNLR